MKYIAIVECTDAGGFEIGMAVIQMGYRPVFVLNPEGYKADLLTSLTNFKIIESDTTNAENIAQAIKLFDGEIVALTTLVDSRIAPTTEAAEKASLFGPDHACIILKDKDLVAKLCEEYSLPTLSFKKDADKAMLLNFLPEKPIILKKRQGCGAVGIEYLHSQSQRANFLKKTDGLEDWIAQEYFTGRLYSIEGFVSEEGISFLGWTSRKKIQNTETEFRFEGFDTINSIITSQAKEAVTLLLQRAHYQKGWFHIEFLINFEENKIALIDANIGRTGGAMLPHVLAMSHKQTASNIYQHAIEIQLFGKSNIRIESNKNDTTIYKCICYGSPTETVIQQVILPRVKLLNSGIRVINILGEGTTVSKIGTDDWSWIGFVAGEENKVDQFVSKIKIKTNSNQLLSASF